MARSQRLVVISNRVPQAPSLIPAGERLVSTSGLVNALRPALKKHRGVWFGWSGKSNHPGKDVPPTVTGAGSIELVTIDLSRSDLNLYYSAFSNQTLWPLLHSFPERVVIRDDAYRAYRKVNRRFAEALMPTLRKGDLVWVHDYHLFHVGQELRNLGWQDKIGFFLHIPFPPSEVFAILPWAREILESLTSYDLVGLHTTRYAHNLIDTLVTELGGVASGNSFSNADGGVTVDAYPIGIDVDDFVSWSEEDDNQEIGRLLRRLPHRQMVILGVDRLDYTKGVPERLLAFERLLERFPSLRGQVTLVQISAPTRGNMPEYVEVRNRVDQLVGRINGRFAQAGWLPVYYMYRAYSQQELAMLYRRTDVALVTPLRDGMNLVAKEFVAAQDDDPGVLVLSKFCGAAETMQDAIIVNPYDIDGMATAIQHALHMPLAERRSRWESLLNDVRTHDARYWCDSFVADLTGEGALERPASGPMAR
jgi:trehalose 6-phosphate synthase